MRTLQLLSIHHNSRFSNFFLFLNFSSIPIQSNSFRNFRITNQTSLTRNFSQSLLCHNTPTLFHHNKLSDSIKFIISNRTNNRFIFYSNLRNFQILQRLNMRKNNRQTSCLNCFFHSFLIKEKPLIAYQYRRNKRLVA